MGEWMRVVRTTQLSTGLLASGAALGLLSCGGDDVTAPSTGSLEITTVTNGPEPDADGYAVTIDAGAEAGIGLNGTHRRDGLEPGSHGVQLTGLAANCTVAGDNPRTVTIAAGATATVEFTITCGPTTGSLEVTTSTSGPSPDADGYSITVDGSDKGALAGSAEITLTGLAPGDHQVGLSGIAGNCSVEGQNPRTIVVVAGETTPLTFAVSCVTPPPTTGTLTITTATTGPSLDADGYTVSVDGGSTQPIGINATLTVSTVASGSHTVALAGLALNCSTQGANPRQVTVSAGQQVSVSFAVRCPTPVLRWQRMESGTQEDLTRVWVNPAGEAAAGFAFPACFVPNNPGCVPDRLSPAPHTPLLRLDKSGWSEQSFGGDWFVTDLWGRSASESFAVGWIYTDPQHDFLRGVVLRYRNGTWTEMPGVPAPIAKECWHLQAVWGTESELFAVGSGCQEGSGRTEGPGMVAHYDGVSWSATVQGSGLYDVSGTSPRDVYAVDQAADIFDHESDDILHYDGVSWSTVLSSEAGSDYDPSTLQSDFDRVWAASPTSVFVLGHEYPPDEAPVEFFILRYDGNSWSEVFRTTELGLGDIWGSSPTDVYVLAGSRQDVAILHYDGVSWTRQPTPMGKRLYGIWGRSATDVYAVGPNGTILHGAP